MKEIHVRDREMVRLGVGLGAPLRRSEIRLIKEIAAREGFKSVARWCAAKLRELIEPGAGYDIAGDPRTPSLRGVMKQTSPLLSQPGTARAENAAEPRATESTQSWANLTAEEKAKLAPSWMKKVPLPAGFKEWHPVSKARWLDLHWPLGAEVEEDLEW